MRRIVLLFLLTGALRAGPITIGPIEMTGSGSFGWDYGLGTFERFKASGTDGVNTVFLSIDGGTEYPLLTPPPTYATQLDRCYSNLSFVTINGITGQTQCGVPNGTNYFNMLTIGNGGGQVDLFTAPSTWLIHANLIGFVEITSYQDIYWNDSKLVGVRGEFNITPTHMPEPNAGLLMGLGLSILLAILTRRSWNSR